MTVRQVEAQTDGPRLQTHHAVDTLLVASTLLIMYVIDYIIDIIDCVLLVHC